MSSLPVISIIICTYNRAGLLDKCLASLFEQKVNPNLYDVIVIDNNSKDETATIVSKYVSKYNNIEYIVETNQGLSYARNRGYQEATAEYLAYVDDDAITPPTYIVNVLTIIEKYRPDILGGPVYPYYIEPKPGWFQDKYEIREHASTSGFCTTCRVSGGNFIIRRDLLRELGLFDTTLGMIGDKIGLGEERAVLETYRRQIQVEQQKVYYALECFIRHYVPPHKMTWKYMITRYYRIGRTAARVKQKDPSFALGLIIKFLPQMSQDLVTELKTHGAKEANYADVLLQSLIRLGNIVELMSHGVKPVIAPLFSINSYSFLLKPFKFLLKKLRKIFGIRSILYRLNLLIAKIKQAKN